MDLRPELTGLVAPEGAAAVGLLTAEEDRAAEEDLTADEDLIAEADCEAEGDCGIKDDRATVADCVADGNRARAGDWGVAGDCGAGVDLAAEEALTAEEALEAEGDRVDEVEAFLPLVLGLLLRRVLLCGAVVSAVERGEGGASSPTKAAEGCD